MAYVYRHIRLDKNEPFYIGIGSDTNGKFIRANSLTKGRNILHQNILNKTEVRVDIILDDLTWEEACEKEKEFISLYGRIDLGTGCLSNMTLGGDGIKELSLKSKQILSEKAKLNHILKPEKYLHSTDTRNKISKALLGKEKTEIHKSKLSKSKIGKVRGAMTEEQKVKISIANKGNKRYDVSERNKNRIGPCKGKIFITNGINNKVIQHFDPIPAGWYKGKTNKTTL
jgi:hypothetical protein